MIEVVFGGIGMLLIMIVAIEYYFVNNGVE